MNTKKESEKKESGLWQKCPKCEPLLIKEELKNNLSVCNNCLHHFDIPLTDRIINLFDDENFEILFDDVQSADPLSFFDKKPYSERLLKLSAEKEKDSFVATCGKISGQKVAVGFSNYSFMGGSMGSVMGEKITRLFELAIEQNLPVIIFSLSGGARMQESTLSLMQMAKTSQVCARFKKKVKKPFISVLCNPTTGGVAASFSWLGDFTIAEPKALICFAGPRVVEQTIGEKLPEGFQRSEFLFEKGMIDEIVNRTELKQKIIKILGLF